MLNAGKRPMIVDESRALESDDLIGRVYRRIMQQSLHGEVAACNATSRLRQPRSHGDSSLSSIPGRPQIGRSECAVHERFALDF